MTILDKAIDWLGGINAEVKERESRRNGSAIAERAPTPEQAFNPPDYIRQDDATRDSLEAKRELLAEKKKEQEIENESGAIRLLGIECAECPIINLDFLSMSRGRFPRFAVFPWLPVTAKFGELVIHIEERKLWFGHNQFLPMPVKLRLAQCLFPNIGLQYADEDYAEFLVRSRAEPGYWAAKLCNEPHALETEFIGLIPQKTKTIIRDQSEMFDNTMLICEIEPTAWRQKAIQTDPLLVGWHEVGQQSYLLDWFGCTQAEEYMRREFTK